MPDTLHAITAKQDHSIISFFSTVKFLADLYVEGESTYVLEQGEKMANVMVKKRTEYKLSPDAMAAFEAKHDDDWEINICQRYPHDPLIGGKYMSFNVSCLRNRLQT